MNRHPDYDDITKFLSDMDAGELEVALQDRNHWRKSHFGENKYRYRFVPKPKTVFTKRIEIPAPYRGEMEREQKYYTPNIYEPETPIGRYWSEMSPHTKHREKGLVYFTPEDAAAAGRAMVERDDD